jgi:hypothetical protein
MNVSDDTRAELEAINQEQTQNEIAAQAEREAVAQYNPDTFADPTDDHIDRFNFVESRGFLTVFLESLLVNFYPEKRDMYFSVAGFTKGDPATDHRLQFAHIAETNAPPPAGNADMSGKIAPVSHFSRGNGPEVAAVYDSADEIYGEKLASAARDMQTGFSQAAAYDEAVPTQLAENNRAASYSIPAATV